MNTKDKVRHLPDEKPLVETGPIQFGQDRPGLFIRGEKCAYFQWQIHEVLNRYPDTSNLKEYSDEHVNRFALEQLLDLFEHVTGPDSRGLQ